MTQRNVSPYKSNDIPLDSDTIDAALGLLLIALIGFSIYFSYRLYCFISLYSEYHTLTSQQGIFANKGVDTYADAISSLLQQLRDLGKQLLIVGTSMSSVLLVYRTQRSTTDIGKYFTIAFVGACIGWGVSHFVVLKFTDSFIETSGVQGGYCTMLGQVAYDHYYSDNFSPVDAIKTKLDSIVIQPLVALSPCASDDALRKAVNSHIISRDIASTFEEVYLTQAKRSTLSKINDYRSGYQLLQKQLSWLYRKHLKLTEQLQSNSSKARETRLDLYNKLTKKVQPYVADIVIKTTMNSVELGQTLSEEEYFQAVLSNFLATKVDIPRREIYRMSASERPFDDFAKDLSEKIVHQIKQRIESVDMETIEQLAGRKTLTGIEVFSKAQYLFACFLGLAIVTCFCLLLLSIVSAASIIFGVNIPYIVLFAMKPIVVCLAILYFYDGSNWVEQAFTALPSPAYFEGMYADYQNEHRLVALAKITYFVEQILR